MVVVQLGSIRKHKIAGVLFLSVAKTTNVGYQPMNKSFTKLGGRTSSDVCAGRSFLLQRPIATTLRRVYGRPRVIATRAPLKDIVAGFVGTVLKSPGVVVQNMIKLYCQTILMNGCRMFRVEFKGV